MNGERGPRTVYRARVVHRRRRLLFGALVLLGAVAIGVVVARGGGGRVVYDRAAAAAYADRWALSDNPAYWHSKTDDCADFVSQCVAAGGLRPLSGSAGSWRAHGRAFPSIGWVNCEAQQRVWSVGSDAAAPYITSTSTRLPSRWEAGDVIYLGNLVDGAPQWQHAIICVGKRHGRWVYDSHTVAHRHRTLATWYPAHFTLIRFCHLADVVRYG
jgi:hypothetical protein